AERAVALLDAPMVKGGTYPVILDPELAGVFIHEAFGHLSEADFVYENPQAREMMTLGRRFGKPVLNVGDNGAASGLRGTIPFDGQTMLEDFAFTAAYGRMIRDGHVAELVKDVVLAGNLFQTLDRIDHIAADFRWNQMGGGCGKGGQFPLPVTEGAPHVRIEE